MVRITDGWLERAVEQMASGELGGMFVNRDDVVALIRECQRLRAAARQAPDHPSWTEDAEGYVVAPLENRGTLDAG